MTKIGRVFAGTGLGILGAYLGFPAMLSFYPGTGSPQVISATFLWMLPVLVIIAGPGAFVLSCIHSAQLERWAPRARNVRQIRRVGVLLGLPLGIANLVLVFGVFSILGGRDLTLTADMAPWLIPALAGGAGLGWGVTLGLKPGKAAPRRRIVVPAPRRDGPPFFDNRPARMIRRAS